MGNDFPVPATTILARWAGIMRHASGDRILIGMDSTTDVPRIWNSYHDAEGLFERFMRGGLENANRVLGVEWYRPEDVSSKWNPFPPLWAVSGVKGLPGLPRQCSQIGTQDKTDTNCCSGRW